MADPTNANDPVPDDSVGPDNTQVPGDATTSVMANALAAAAQAMANAEKSVADAQRQAQEAVQAAIAAMNTALSRPSNPDPGP